MLGDSTPGPGSQGRNIAKNTYTQQHTWPAYLQLDLLLPQNLTGPWGGGWGLEEWAVMVGWGWAHSFSSDPCPTPQASSRRGLGRWTCSSSAVMVYTGTTIVTSCLVACPQPRYCCPSLLGQ